MPSEVVEERAESLTTGAADRVRAIAEEVIAGTDMFVVEVNIRGKKGSRIVEVFLDSEAGLDVEMLARASRQIGERLETEDFIEGKYFLHASSPGADKPLLLPRQYHKHIGRTLEVTRLAPQPEVTEKLVGRLEKVEENAIWLKPEKGEAVQITWNDLVSARVRLPW